MMESSMFFLKIAFPAVLFLFLGPVQASDVFGVKEYTRHYEEAEREHEGKERRWVSEGNGCFRMMIDGERGSSVECFDEHGNHLKSDQWEFRGQYGNGRFPPGVLTLGQRWEHDTEIHNSQSTWMDARVRRCHVTAVGEREFGSRAYPTATVSCEYRKKIGNSMIYNEYMEVLNKAGAPRLTLSHSREGGSSRSKWELTAVEFQ